MFIPNRKIRIGDEVILTEDCASCAGAFTKGTNMSVKAIGERGYMLEDNNHNIIDEVSSVFFKLKNPPEMLIE